MTEQEYIDATNLAKVRAAKQIFRDILPSRDTEERHFSKALAAISNLEDRLRSVVKTKA